MYTFKKNKKLYILIFANGYFGLCYIKAFKAKNSEKRNSFFFSYKLKSI